jgi:hypothetical protein
LKHYYFVIFKDLLLHASYVVVVVESHFVRTFSPEIALNNKLKMRSIFCPFVSSPPHAAPISFILHHYQSLQQVVFLSGQNPKTVFAAIESSLVVSRTNKQDKAMVIASSSYSADVRILIA